MGVSIQGTGSNALVNAQVDPVHSAVRVSHRPPDKNGGGSYSLAMTSGLVAAGMTGPLPIWEMRWPVSPLVALVRRVQISAAAVTLFTAGAFTVSLSRATGFSVLDTTGAAAAPTLLGRSQARSSRFAQSTLQSNVQAFAILNTANTGLTAGTKTLDNNPLARVTGGVPVTGGTGSTAILQPTALIDSFSSSEEPVELAGNEGLVIQADAVPATGTWIFSVSVSWDEVDPAKYFAV